MPQSDPLEILLSTDRWANRQIVDACARLSEEQFHRRFEMGPGSLHDTLVHMATALRVWADVLRRGDVRPRLEGQRMTVVEVGELLAGAIDDLTSLAQAEPLSSTVTRVRDGQTYQFTRGAVLTQVLSHGFHHRAQCLNMLRQLGVSLLPMSAVVEWVRSGEPM